MHPGELSSIFEYREIEGFQDIWFEDLNSNEVAKLYLFACSFGKEPTEGIVVASGLAQQSADRLDSRNMLRDTWHDLKGFAFDDIELADVFVRIENDGLAIDFQAGLAYWTAERIHAFIRWLRVLCRHSPNARLTWATEGCRSRPSGAVTNILREAVAGDV